MDLDLGLVMKVLESGGNKMKLTPEFLASSSPRIKKKYNTFLNYLLNKTLGLENGFK
jgi:hypothetical protein